MAGTLPCYLTVRDTMHRAITHAMTPLPHSAFKNALLRVLVVAQGVKKPTTIHEDAGSTPGLAQWANNTVLL